MFGSVESETLAEAEFPVESGRRVSQPVVLYDRSLSKDEDKMRVLGMFYKTLKTGFFSWFTTVEFASVPHPHFFCRSVPVPVLRLFFFQWVFGKRSFLFSVTRSIRYPEPGRQVNHKISYPVLV